MPTICCQCFLDVAIGNDNKRNSEDDKDDKDDTDDKDVKGEWREVGREGITRLMLRIV